jgi:hypothetical protein
MRRQIPPGLAWLLVFGPAVLYLFVTRLGRSREYGQLVVVVLVPADADHPATAPAPAATLYLVADGFANLTDAVWRHDSDMGRGYLLVSESAAYGRVWRWELGGGPISIGKTLHLDQSGCRTLQCTTTTTTTTTTTSRRRKEAQFADGSIDPPARGSGALAIQFARDAASAREGPLLVAEWGEGRIVRLEDNGARTPVLLMTDDAISTSSHHLVNNNQKEEEEEVDSNTNSNNNNDNHQKEEECEPTIGYPHRMVMTATGDLIVVGTYTFRRHQQRTLVSSSSSSSDTNQEVEDEDDDNVGAAAASCVTVPALNK